MDSLDKPNFVRLNGKNEVSYRTLTATAFAVTLVATLALASFLDQPAFARPQPDVAVGDHVMKINLKGVVTSNLSFFIFDKKIQKHAGFSCYKL